MPERAAAEAARERELASRRLRPPWARRRCSRPAAREKVWEDVDLYESCARRRDAAVGDSGREGEAAKRR